MRVNIREAMQVPTLVRHMLKNNVPAPSCIPPAGLEVLTRRHVNDALSELHPRSGLQVLKGDNISEAQAAVAGLWRALV